MIYQEGYFSIH